MNETRGNIEIDLKRIAVALLSRAWLILLVGAILGTAAFSYAWYGVAPTYSASAQLYVNNNYKDSPGYSSSQLMAAQQLADTYMVIMRSRNVLKDVQDKTQLGYTIAQLKGMITASSVNNTEIFQVTVTCRDYKHAAIIANAIADVLPLKSPKIVEGSTVTVVDYAQENPSKVGPSYSKYAIMGAMIGCVLMAGFIVIVELTDSTIHSEEYLATVYKEYPLLAVVPGAESIKGGYKGYYRGSYEVKKSPEEKKPAEKKPNDKTGGAKK